MGARFKTAYTKHFFGATCEGNSHPLSTLLSIVSLYLSLLLLCPGFYHILNHFFILFFSSRPPLILFSILLPHLLHYCDNSYFLHQLSLKGPVAVNVIIFLVRLHADCVSLLPSLFHNPDCPFVFTLMK